MFRQFISSAAGSQVYLITSLAIFLVFFIVVTVMLFQMKKDFVKHMSELPLEDDNNSTRTQNEYNETNF